MNKETKYLIEKAINETKTDIFACIKDLRVTYGFYHENLKLLKSYAETLGCSESDIIDVLGCSIKEIEQAKEKALEGEMLWQHNLEKVAWERKQEKITDNTLPTGLEEGE